MAKASKPLERLRHHVTGAIERGEAKAIEEIRAEEDEASKDVAWKDGEWGYIHGLVAKHGDEHVGHDPKNVAAYIRLQASSAFRDQRFRLSACLGAAATAINEDARNDHAPDWDRAIRCLNYVSP